MDINIRRKGGVVHRCCSSDETRPLLWEHGRGLACVMGCGRHCEDIAVVVLWHVRQNSEKPVVFFIVSLQRSHVNVEGSTLWLYSQLCKG